MLSVVLSVLLSVVLSHENGTGDPVFIPETKKKGLTVQFSKIMIGRGRIQIFLFCTRRCKNQARVHYKVENNPKVQYKVEINPKRV